MRRSVFAVAALAVAFALHAGVSAQSPHGGATAKPQPGPNVNTAAGIVANPLDPAAFLKSDLLLQRQNETIMAASTRNPDHLLAAANDYRFVDFPDDPYFGEQGFLTRLIAKLFRRPAAKIPARAVAAVGGWTGLYRSCDRGGTWTGGALPGSPLDQSPASLASPMKLLSNSAELQGGHAETTDPVLVAGPSGRMHLAVLGFVRFPNGRVGESRMYYASYTDRNNREGGSCFDYDYSVQIDSASNYAGPGATAPFLDKPWMAVDKDGTIYVSYTLFTDAEKSRIVVARSADNGASWTTTSPLLSIGALRNHGSSLAIDPLNGEVYVAWRVFYDNWPLMVVARSTNGKVFLPASPISDLFPTRNLEQIVAQLKGEKLQPFDQFSSAAGAPATARALAFPHLVAGVVGGKTRLYAVWQERADVNPQSPTFGYPSATGSPRVMFTMSSNGLNWTPRRAIDAGPRTENALQPGLGPEVTRPSGPQLQPALNISGTANPELLLAYYEARGELELPFESNFVSGIERQMDVRVARIDPSTGLLRAASTQVSQYPVKTNSGPDGATAQWGERAEGSGPAVNLPNLKMYSGGNNGFFGDYMALASSKVFEWSGGKWNWAADPSPALAMWTDSRHARFPINTATGLPDINGDWTAYTPLRPTLPAMPPPTCGNVGMRDSNPYFSEIGAVVAGSPQTFKPLTVQRAFVAYVANRTAVDRTFRLEILDNETAGLDGSFDQSAFGAAGDVREVTIFANSSNVQTVWVQPNLGNPTASVRVKVEETNSIGGAIKANGLKATIVLNPDPNNNALTPVPSLVPGFDGNPAGMIEHTELHNPQISTPQISTFNIRAPQISSPQISTPQISTPQISTPQISTPQISTPQISTPQISTPQISTPQISTPQISTVSEDNGTDVVYTVNNIGNTWSAYNVLFNVPNVDALLTSGNYQFQVIVTRTSLIQGFTQTAQGCAPAAVPQVQVLANIPIPANSVPQISTIRNPQIATPQISTPQIATFALAPLGGVAGLNDPLAAEQIGTVLPDEVKITLRAIRLTPISAGGPTFDPAQVITKLASQSTNVIAGVPQPPGSQPVVVEASGGAFVTQPSNGTANVALSPVVRVRVLDTTGAIVPGAPVTLSLSVNPTGATLTGNNAVSGVDGIAQFPSLAVNLPGTGYVLTATSGAFVIGHSVSFDIAVGSLIVTSVADNGPGTLRQAILNANANTPALDTITFNIGGPTRIILATPLPQITDGVVIDGTSQPGFGGGNRVWVDGAIGLAAGFVVTDTGGGSTIKGLSITGFTSHGIQLAGDDNTVASNFIGLTPAGLAAANGEGVFVNATKNNTIGGANLNDGNVISGNNGHGVMVTGGADATLNKVFNNYIGVSVNGLNALPNGGSGVYLSAPSTIGGPGKGNVISGNNQNGIAILNDDSQSTIQGNLVGTNALGTAALPNGANGIQISDAEFSVIGGTIAGARNVVSGNAQAGILLTGDASATTIQGNYIGLNAAGDTALGNGADGVHISSSPSAMVGGTTVAARNVISGNLGNGVTFLDSANSDILGNYIGTDATGTLDRGNTLDGIFVDETSNVRIGGSAAGAGNLISGNDEYGILIDTDSDTTTVAGNFIGVNAAGTLELHNGHNDPLFIGDLTHAGIRIDGTDNQIGLPAATGGNVISGNNIGISIVAGATGNVIQNNRVGLNAAGTGAIRNRKFGIFVNAPATIGGDVLLEPAEDALEGNVISGNGLQGVVVSAGGAGTVIKQNYIGTNVAGTGAVANTSNGVQVQLGASAEIVGNVISGNSGSGIRLETGSNTVQGNLIGIGADDSPLGNSGGFGVSITGSSNQIGGVNPGEYNRIANNGSGGVDVASGAGNRIQRNQIHDNGGLGIDLGADGVTANDSGDGDAGANELQNYPVVTSANSAGDLSVTLSSTPNTVLILEFFRSTSCDGTGNGEGELFINYTVLGTGPSGTLSFSINFGALPNGSYVTATATDPSGNTSEFSPCQLVTPPAPEPVSLSAAGESGSRLAQPPPGVGRERVGRLGAPADLQK
jgi:Right handed beta helix region